LKQKSELIFTPLTFKQVNLSEDSLSNMESYRALNEGRNKKRERNIPALKTGPF
jgi:hypothetical protein